MNNFKYLQPKSLQEASHLILENKKDALFFAGGTDVLGLIKNNVVVVFLTTDKLITNFPLMEINNMYEPIKFTIIHTFELSNNELIILRDINNKAIARITQIEYNNKIKNIFETLDYNKQLIAGIVIPKNS